MKDQRVTADSADSKKAERQRTLIVSERELYLVRDALAAYLDKLRAANREYADYARRQESDVMFLQDKLRNQARADPEASNELQERAATG